MSKTVNLIGKRFGRWVVIKKLSGRYWQCRCDCGTERHVYTSSLTDGRTFSCGCWRAEVSQNSMRKVAENNRGKPNVNRTHGEAIARTPEYRTWLSMRERCANPRSGNSKYYGARGIRVCERWDSYEAFLADMGRRPTPQHSLDRVNNNEGYSPENCRWATKKEQQNNRRKFGRVESFSDDELAAELARRMITVPLSLPV